MSLNQKYTWNDFLKSHPEYKEKKIKRTSKEGAKAFESAAKQHLKEYLKERLAKIDKEKERAEKDRKRLGSYIARLERIRSRTKTLQKGL